jgi:hypothetical protein
MVIIKVLKKFVYGVLLTATVAASGQYQTIAPTPETQESYEALKEYEAQNAPAANREADLEHHDTKKPHDAKNSFDITCSKFAEILEGKRILKGIVPDTVCVVAKPRTKSPIKIMDIETKSPLVNTALFSFEQGKNKRYLNLGETGAVSKEIPPFRDMLDKQGIGITAIHTHWLESKPSDLMYIHWMSSENPLTFAKKTNNAWKAAFA